MKEMILVKKTLPQNLDIEVLVPNYKEPILPVNHGGFGWYGLMAYNEQGQLMCHECGEFRHGLYKHIRKHNLNPKEYKLKYGLLQKHKLASSALSLRLHDALKNNPELVKRNYERFMRIRKLGELQTENDGMKSIEFQNRYDTCPAQLLRWLSDAAKVYGLDVTCNEAETIRSGLSKLLRERFGSFNKAKQIVRLVANGQGPKFRYTKELILEDMCSYYSKYHYWPTRTDYDNRKLICNHTILHNHGGIKALRQEAMKLRQEQEARRIKGEGIPQIANNIELENAGYARR